MLDHASQRSLLEFRLYKEAKSITVLRPIKEFYARLKCTFLNSFNLVIVIKTYYLKL